MSIFDKLIEKNEFPIVFIGAGMPKRYLKSYPNWEELLESLWNEVDNSDFYSHLNILKNDIIEKNPQMDTGEIDFLVNIKVAGEIEKKVNEDFHHGKIKIENLTSKDVYKNNLSPFKKLLAMKFSSYEIETKVMNEFEDFKKMLVKTQIILTTNYDSLIEDSYNSVIKDSKLHKYIGQQGFFEQGVGYAELYKIHGCSQNSESLVINEEDYKKFDSNSVLISAKIISSLLNSPIIFLGYSLTDRNVRKIIKDFTSSLNEKEKVQLENRLIVIQRKENQNNIIEEVIIDKDLNCRLTSIKTDNYSEIYRKIQKINQGVTPSEIRRYQHVIRELIVERGKQGTLDTLLISPKDLEDMEKLTNNSNLVVAIGDSKILFRMPTVIDYVLDYISEKTEQNIEIILRFLASQQTKSILPMMRFLTEYNIENCSLHKHEKQKLKNRIEVHGNLTCQINSLTSKQEYNSLNEILNEKFSRPKEYSLISYNIEKILLSEIKNYILKEINILREKGEINIDTGLKRLILIYDLKKNIIK